MYLHHNVPIVLYTIQCFHDYLIDHDICSYPDCRTPNNLNIINLVNMASKLKYNL